MFCTHTGACVFVLLAAKLDPWTGKSFGYAAAAGTICVAAVFTEAIARGGVRQLIALLRHGLTEACGEIVVMSVTVMKQQVWRVVMYSRAEHDACCRRGEAADHRGRRSEAGVVQG